MASHQGKGMTTKVGGNPQEPMGRVLDGPVYRRASDGDMPDCSRNTRENCAAD